jgi:hypothetical protein
MGKRAEQAVDLVALARQHPAGITFADAAVAMFGEDTDQGRRSARLRLLRHYEAGRLRRVRATPDKWNGSRPDRFVVVDGPATEAQSHAKSGD